MTNLARKFLSTLSVGIVGSAPIAMMPLSMVAAAEKCLTSPQGQTPAGKHWYYRSERGSKRQCWYLRELGETGDQGTTSRPTRLATPDGAAARETELTRSAADAHAELPPWPQTLVETRSKSAQSSPTTSVSLTVPEQIASNNASPETVESAVVVRWPGLTGALSPADRSPFVIASAAPDASLDVSVEPYLTSQAPSIAPTKMKAAASIPTGWLQVLLLGTFGAVAISWLLGGSLIARTRRRRRRPPVLGSPARLTDEPTNRMSIPPRPSRFDLDIRAGSSPLGRQRSVLGDHSREILELLALFANQEVRPSAPAALSAHELGPSEA
jgi:hypothetical protein